MLCGGDVHYELPGTLKQLTTAAIRGDTESDASRALHRIILSIVGEPLQWKYKDDLHLLRAFRDIVESEHKSHVSVLTFKLMPVQHTSICAVLEYSIGTSAMELYYSIPLPQSHTNNPPLQCQTYNHPFKRLSESLGASSPTSIWLV